MLASSPPPAGGMGSDGRDPAGRRDPAVALFWDSDSSSDGSLYRHHKMPEIGDELVLAVASGRYRPGDGVSNP